MSRYFGSCHCGQVRYEVEVDLSGGVMSCNCSICARRGHLLTFVPEKQLTLLKGEQSLTDYQFNKKNVHHLFCKTCGVNAFARGTDRKGQAVCMINVRCLEGVDLKALKVTEVDGKSF